MKREREKGVLIEKEVKKVMELLELTNSFTLY
jgi:hypothetical protein